MKIYRDQRDLAEKNAPTTDTDCDPVPRLSMELNNLSALVMRIEKVDVEISCVLIGLRGEVQRNPSNVTQTAPSGSVFDEIKGSLEQLNELVESLESQSFELREYI